MGSETKSRLRVVVSSPLFEARLVIPSIDGDASKIAKKPY